MTEPLEDTSPGTPTSKSSQRMRAVCARCHEYRMQIARLSTEIEREAGMRLVAERRAKALADELRELRKAIR